MSTDESDPASPYPSDPVQPPLDERIVERRAEEERRFIQIITEHLTARAAEQEEMLLELARAATARLERKLVDRRATAERELEEWRSAELARVERALRDEVMHAEERIERHRREVERDLTERLARLRDGTFGRTSEVGSEAAATAGGSEDTTERAAIVGRARSALAGADTARDLGRALRDAVSSLVHASAFAIVLFHPTHDEVAYRYRVSAEDELSIALGGQPVDKSRDIDAVRSDRRYSTFVRTVRVGTADEHTVAVAQIPLRDDSGVPIGIATLQTSAAEGFAEADLAVVADLIVAAAPRFAEARRLRRFRDPLAS